jgi:hypothetical protein
VLLFNNCGGPLRANTSGESQSGSAQEDPNSVSNPTMNALPCSFNGQVIASGAPVTAYAASTVPNGGVCQSETRVCNNGVLSGTYGFAQCAVNQPAACLLGTNVTVPSGGTAVAYQNSSVPYGQTCASETVTCTNGMLSGTYRSPSCTVASQTQPTVPAGTLAEVRVLLWSETVPNFGNPCPAGWVASVSAHDGGISSPDRNRYGLCSRPYTSSDTEVITSFYVAGSNEACPSGMSKAGDLIRVLPNGTQPSDQYVGKSPLCVKKEPAATASRYVYKLSYKNDPGFADCGGYDYCQYWY